MNLAWSGVIIALISGPLMWVLYRFEKVNTKQHGNSMAKISKIENSVFVISRDLSKIDTKIDIHIIDHRIADGDDN